MPDTKAGHWFTRHWRWLVPAVVATVLLGCVGFVAVVVLGVFGLLKSSTPYAQALALVRSNERVQRAIGEPITPGWLVSGSVQISGSKGNARLLIPIAGPKGQAEIVVVATRAEGRWTYAELAVQVKGTGERIVLEGRGRSGDLVKRISPRLQAANVTHRHYFF